MFLILPMDRLYRMHELFSDFVGFLYILKPSLISYLLVMSLDDGQVANTPIKKKNKTSLNKTNSE